MSTKCPNCRSENLEKRTKEIHHGPSFMDGCCGAICFGPVGMLCSLCGMYTETKEYWYCPDCGKEFSEFQKDVADEVSAQVESFQQNQKEKNEKKLNEIDSRLEDVGQWEITGETAEELNERYAKTYEQYEAISNIVENFQKEMREKYPFVKNRYIIKKVVTILLVCIGIPGFLFGLNGGGPIVGVVAFFGMLLGIGKMDDWYKQSWNKISSEEKERMDMYIEKREQLYKEKNKLSDLVDNVKKKDSLVSKQEQLKRKLDE